MIRLWNTILAALLPGRHQWRERMTYQRDEAELAIRELRTAGGECPLVRDVFAPPRRSRP